MEKREKVMEEKKREERREEGRNVLRSVGF